MRRIAQITELATRSIKFISVLKLSTKNKKEQTLRESALKNEIENRLSAYN